MLTPIARAKLRPSRLVTREMALEDLTDAMGRMTHFDTIGLEVITDFA